MPNPRDFLPPPPWRGPPLPKFLTIASSKCGKAVRPLFEKAAKATYGPSPALAGTYHSQAQEALYKCLGIKPSIEMADMADDEVERWFSFFSLWWAARLIERGNYKEALELLEDQEQSYEIPRAGELGILQDYGPARTHELHSLTKEARISLEQGNTPKATLFADRVANLQYDLAVERAGIPPPGFFRKYLPEIKARLSYSKEVPPGMRDRVEKLISSLPEGVDPKIKRIIVTDTRIVRPGYPEKGYSARWIESERTMRLWHKFADSDFYHEVAHALNPELDEKAVELAGRALETAVIQQINEERD